MTKKYGIEVGGEYLFNLRFADDFLLLTNSADHLQKTINERGEQSRWTKDESTEHQSYVIPIFQPTEHYIRRHQT